MIWLVVVVGHSGYGWHAGRRGKAFKSWQNKKGPSASPWQVKTVLLLILVNNNNENMSLRLIQKNTQLIQRSASFLRSKPRTSRRRYSSAVEKESPTRIEEVVAEQNLIIRHGEGDGVVTLNVGGKEFITLRSTLQINPVLYARVLKAEANNELMKNAVFVDRDPTHFGLILQHLWNVADSITLSSTANKNAWLRLISNPKNEVNIQIPENTSNLRELFVEARYFKIKELEDALSGYDLFTWVASVISGQGAANPFHVAVNAIKMVRRTLLTTGGLGILIGSQNESLVSSVQETMGSVYGWATSLIPSNEVEGKGEGEGEKKAGKGWFSSGKEESEMKPSKGWFWQKEDESQKQPVRKVLSWA
jgi:hypothetical protein